MPWVITALVAWIMFYFLVDFGQLKRTIFGGMQLGLYKFYDIIIPWAGCSIFYKFGPIFVIGVLFTQYLPSKKWLQLVNIFVVSLIYLSLEALVLQTHAAEYKHWHLLASFLVDLGAMTVLTYVGQTFKLSNQEHARLR